MDRKTADAKDEKKDTTAGEDEKYPVKATLNNLTSPLLQNLSPLSQTNVTVIIDGEDEKKHEVVGKKSALLERRKLALLKRGHSESSLFVKTPKNLNLKKTGSSAPILNESPTLIRISIKEIKKLLLLETFKAIWNDNCDWLNILLGPDLRDAFSDAKADLIAKKHRDVILLKYSLILISRLTNEVKAQISNPSTLDFNKFRIIYDQTITDATKEYSAVMTKTPYVNNHIFVIKIGDKNFKYLAEKFKLEADSFLCTHKFDPTQDDNLEKFYGKLNAKWVKIQKKINEETKKLTEDDQTFKEQIELTKAKHRKLVLQWVEERKKNHDLVNKELDTLLTHANNDVYEKIKSIITLILINTEPNYIYDIDGSTPLDLSFKLSRLKITEFLINRGIYNFTAHSLKYGIDKMLELLTTKQINLLLIETPIITDFKKNILLIIHEEIKKLSAAHSRSKKVDAIFSYIPIINRFYKKMPGIFLAQKINIQ